MATKRSAHVIVLGDLSRSPRILSQAQFLARDGWDVTISGYKPDSISPSNFKLRVLNIPTCPDFKALHFPSFLVFIFKFIFTSVALFFHLIKHCRSHLILIQNPPAVPTFIVVWIFMKITGRSLVIDWHNYGYTLVELISSRKSVFARLYYMLEVDFASYFMSRMPDRVAHLCVSKALKCDLEAKSIKATVYYDRPLEEFKATSVDAAHYLFMKLSDQYEVFKNESGSCRLTRFTEVTALPTSTKNSKPIWRPDRPALVVSSCSWTPDDDFTLAIKALSIYDEAAQNPSSGLPNVVFAVTGRGPLRTYYAKLIKQQNWKHVEVIMPWLEWSDYPVFLGCADLGISLHRSSSGLDLPMKVVDLLGVNVPVLALGYSTLYELMEENKCGLCFGDSYQLADQMCELLKPSCDPTIKYIHEPSRFLSVGSEKLIHFREFLTERNKTTVRGFTHWKNIALPVYEKVVPMRSNKNKGS
ncbi:Chitobiosyldiphosphodolichol beta-mannosyltransferase [Schistosoma japonicum]|nr:Chitobiosyldiphosphodolichol beta-mannosyltransferase [Schistosoma japonicum]